LTLIFVYREDQNIQADRGRAARQRRDKARKRRFTGLGITQKSRKTLLTEVMTNHDINAFLA
jgi:hypothetical protein